MTEDEAKTKWCPFARSIEAKLQKNGNCEVGSYAKPINRYSLERPERTGIPNGAFCIGSACMVWQWEDAGSLDKPTRVHPAVLKDHWKGWTVTNLTPDEKGYVEISPPPPKLPHGHCGLAGKP